MRPELVTLNEIFSMFAGKAGSRVIEVADVEYQSLLDDANSEGLVVLETEESFSLLRDGLTIKIQREDDET